MDPIASIATSSSVQSIAWRGSKFPFQIVSSSVIVDSKITVWDTRQRFFPIASVRGHVKNVTDVSFVVQQGKHLNLNMQQTNMTTPTIATTTDSISKSGFSRRKTYLSSTRISATSANNSQKINSGGESINGGKCIDIITIRKLNLTFICVCVFVCVCIACLAFFK